MAERRMFAKTIIDSDAFLDMPLSAQCLYFHLSMRADDDGFINNPKKIQRMIGGSDDDAKILIMKKFIIPFESGIVVIKHWKIHNYIQKDRYKETKYLEEKSQLGVKENNAYTLLDAPCIQSGYKMDTQVRLGQDSLELGKESKEETPARTTKHIHGEHKKVRLTDEELQKLQTEYGNAQELIQYLDEYKAMKGVSYKSDYLAIRKWVVNAVEEKKRKTTRPQQTSRRVAQMPSYMTEKPKEQTKEDTLALIRQSYTLAIGFSMEQKAEAEKQKYYELTGRDISQDVGEIKVLEE